LKFLLSATNEHGVHSPFIYSYVTKCLYAKRQYCRGKPQNILFKSIAYFGAQRIGLPAGSEGLRAELQAEFPSIHTEIYSIQAELLPILSDDRPYDILFTHPSQAKILLDSASKEDLIHNDSLLLVDRIHGNATHLSLWKKIKNHPKTTVTVDLFHCGAVFFRREQAKEHFKIRI
jgi:uncharacterized iron-regulated membrane protein